MQTVYFFLCWALGAVILFFWLKNKDNTLTFNDVMVTAILSAFIGGIFSYAADKANLSHWFIYIAFAGLSAFISNKLLDKSKN